MEDLIQIDVNRVYLVSYYNSSSDQDIVFEVVEDRQLYDYIVVGGPPPIKSMRAEMGVCVYAVPEGEDPVLLATKMGGYACKGYPLDRDLVRM